MSYRINTTALSDNTPDIPLSRQLMSLNHAKKVSCREFVKMNAYSESRGLQEEVEAFLVDFFINRHAQTISEPTVDADGFTIVRSGLKVALVDAKAVPDLPLDFYKFQLRERKMKEWRDAKSEVDLSKQSLGYLKKRQRFNL